MTDTKKLLSEEYQQKLRDYAQSLSDLSDRKKQAQETYKQTVKDIDTEVETVENEFHQWLSSQGEDGTVKTEKQIDEGK